jgi:phage repressor protein C with HTH and peptisase S24 domain
VDVVRENTGMQDFRHQRWGLVLVRGASMAPTFRGVRRLALVRFGATPRIGDVVVADRPDRPGQHVIKRVTDCDDRGWWVESDAQGGGLVRADSWLFGPLRDGQVLGVVRWPRATR